MRDTFISTIKRALSVITPKRINDPSLTPAAVMLLFYSKDGEHHVLLNRRTEEVEDHKGEISFPGGAVDSDDAGPQSTALRETQEEMGIQPESVEVLGQLDDVATGTNFVVTTFVGTIPYPYDYRPNPSEIAEVLEIPLRELLAPSCLREEVRWSDGVPTRAYSYAYGKHLIYGATAKILGQFLELVQGVGNGGSQ